MILILFWQKRKNFSYEPTQYCFRNGSGVYESRNQGIEHYRAKRSEYSVLEIPEYWIVDPLDAKVTRLTLVEGWYDPTEYKESDRVHCDLFPNLVLTAQQVLNGNVI